MIGALRVEYIIIWHYVIVWKWIWNLKKSKKVLKSDGHYNIYPKPLDRQTWANSVDPDQMPQNVVFDQGLYCLLLILLVFRHINKYSNEPQWQKIYLWTYASSEHSDQPAFVLSDQNLH